MQTMPATDTDSSRQPTSTTDTLLELLYVELKQMARKKLAGERSNHTLQITALVHEAYLRLDPGASDHEWMSERQFLAAASEVMRRILVDYARARTAAKRGGGARQVPLGELAIDLPMPANDLLAIHEALKQFQDEDPVKAQLVRLRVFAGLTQDKAAEALGISRATANRYWSLAKLRLVALIQCPNG